MWEDDNDNTKIDNLKFNKNFAQKFEQRKRREHIEQAQTKFGKELNKMLEEEGDSEYSSSSSEDEEGELLTENERVNFIKTIAKIREKDPEIYKDEKNFWGEEYFKDVPLNIKEKQNPIYYKDLARQALTEDAKPKKTVRELHDEEQGKLKNAFKAAAGLADDGDDLFKVKTKTNQQIEDENKEFEKFLKNEAKKSRKEEVDMLQRFWGDESKLDETDKFLRKFIMTNGWVDKDKNKYNFEEADEEDERREEEMDDFEEKYNFRFEEPGADQVVTYGRENLDSVRQKPEKRKEKRIEKETRKKEELIQHQEEIKLLKNIKKQEVFERLMKIQSVAGSELSKKEEFNKILDKDFDPKDYDDLMKEEFGKDYYEDEDAQEGELEEYVAEQEKKYDEIPEDKEGEEDNKGEEGAPKAAKQGKAEADQDTLLQPKSAIPLFNRVGIKEQEAKEIADTIGHLWWYCDSCLKGIKEGEARYECLECEDFCQCKKCADMKDHPHKMKKFIVPNGCTPPSDKEIQKIVEDMKFCAECSYKFTEYDFIFELKKNKDFLLCEDCVKGNQTQYKEKDFNKKNPTKVDTEKLAKEDIGKLKDLYKDQELHDLIDSYYALDFEDVISGGIKTRFKYVNVDKNSYGLTDNQMLYADDKVLNQFVSTKKLAPYRPDSGQVKMKVLKKKKNIVVRDAERNERGVVQDIRTLAKLEESGLSKEELKEKAKHRDALRAKIAHKKHRKVKLLNEKDIEGLDYDNEEDEKAVVHEETFEPQKEKKRKLTNSRLKSYGLE